MASNIPSDLTAVRSGPAASEREGDTFRVIDRAMRILHCLSSNLAGMTLTQISTETGLHKATVSRFLKALEKGGFASSAPRTKIWRVGVSFLNIGIRARAHIDIREIARPVMNLVCQNCRETVQLGVLSDGFVSYVEKVEPPDQVLRINTDIGSRRPLHCTAMGKVLLAFHPIPAQAHDIVANLRLEKRTEHTIVSRDALARNIAQVRETGFAVDDREYNDLVTCVAAPVRNASGQCVAALSVSTVAVPTQSKRFIDLLKDVIAAADEISKALGWQSAIASEQMVGRQSRK